VNSEAAKLVDATECPTSFAALYRHYTGGNVYFNKRVWFLVDVNCESTFYQYKPNCSVVFSLIIILV